MMRPRCIFKLLQAARMAVEGQKAAISGTLKNHNFVDITLADLIVEVAGGVCNIDLGESEIEVSVNGCSQETHTQIFKQDK